MCRDSQHHISFSCSNLFLFPLITGLFSVVIALFTNFTWFEIDLPDKKVKKLNRDDNYYVQKGRQLLSLGFE